MEYWTIIDDRHAGPFTAAQLMEMGLTAETPVWYSGLPDWVEASEIEELRLLLAPPVPQAPDIPETPVMPRQPEPSVQPWTPQQVAPQPEPYPAQQAAPQPAAHPVEPEPMPQPAQQWEWQQEAVIPDEPCPPAYLAWSIIVTILCCMPLGVAAIVCSAQVKQAYNRGNLKKAQKMSDWAQWLIMLSIVLGLVWLPVQLAFSGI